jgi:hypothetical protein
MKILPQVVHAADALGAGGGTSHSDHDLFLILCNVARTAIRSEGNAFLGHPLKEDDWDRVIQDDKPGGLGLKPDSDGQRVWRLTLTHVIQTSLFNNVQYGVHFRNIRFSDGLERYIDKTFAWTLDGVTVDLGRKASLSRPAASDPQMMA